MTEVPVPSDRTLGQLATDQYEMFLQQKRLHLLWVCSAVITAARQGTGTKQDGNAVINSS